MTDSSRIPFNRPYMTGSELDCIAQAHLNGALAGDGPFTKKCQAWLESKANCAKALLTHSCTAALEMGALLLDLRPGDEVIMPSYTFVSTANAVVLRGATPVFVDIRQDTLNLDENLIQDAITSKTKAIFPVHYAGVSCEMDSILKIASNNGIKVVEDAAQGVMAKYKGRFLGGIGDLGTYSFHETKNIISGEGGALLVNDPDLIARAEIIREKGTDRSSFFRGEIDKYTWRDVGSSFLPGELTAAFLWGQIEGAQNITKERIKIWQQYHLLLEDLEWDGFLRRPIIPGDCEHNGHMYYFLLNERCDRGSVLSELNAQNINAVFHYVPLHSSKFGRKTGRKHGNLVVTDTLSERLIRLPLWVGLTLSDQQRIVNALKKIKANSF